MLEEKLTITREAAAQATKAYQSGEPTFAGVLEANQDVGSADLDLCDTNAERAAVGTNVGAGDGLREERR